MLQRMGWSQGAGLGASHQGSTEHVRIPLKKDSLGTVTQYDVYVVKSITKMYVNKRQPCVVCVCAVHWGHLQMSI